MVKIGTSGKVREGPAFYSEKVCGCVCVCSHGEMGHVLLKKFLFAFITLVVH